MDVMKPDTEKITISRNRELIQEFLMEAILLPRIRMLKWSKLTNQTPNLKIGYPGQHLASLITGIPGTATGARGKDIADGTEVKSCSRVDQVDTCQKCNGNVMRVQATCPQCGSTDICRNNDSKWLIAIRNEEELDLYLRKVPRTLFIISDYPKFDQGDFSVIRFSAYEIWNQSSRAFNFRHLLEDYYNDIFLKHIKLDGKKTPAPKNFWPYSYQFYLCNPIKTFECLVLNANESPEISITHYVAPDLDRATLPSENLPARLLSLEEKQKLKRNGVKVDNNAEIGEEIKKYLCLRNTSEAKPQHRRYHRM